MGYPSFNKNDSRVAFTALNGTQYNTNYIILNTDKISSSATPLALFTDAKWPVYFATGDRAIGDEVVTGIAEQTQKKMSMTCYPTSFINEVSVKLDQQIISDSRIELINSMGQKVYTYSAPPSSEETMFLNLENVKSGFYVLRISNAKNMGTCRIVKK